MSTEIAKLFASVGADVTDFEKGMKKVKDDMSFAEKGMSGLQSAVGTGLKVAAGIGVAAVGALATGIGYAVTKAADMEQGIANISAVMGLTSDETADLKDLIMDLGLDPKLKVSATEAAQAIEVLGSAGLTMDEIMGGAAKSTVLLANSTGADFAQAGAIATDVMAQFNIKAEDMAGAVDQITGVTVASKFDINDYALALAQAGGVASSVGVSFEDFNATIAATSPSFASGSDAGTSFKTFLTTLIPKSNEAKDVMASLGLVTVDYARMAADLSQVLGHEVEPNFMAVEKAFGETEAGAKAAAISNTALGKAFVGLKAQYEENQFFDDNTGKMKDMDQIADVLQGAFAGLTEEQKNEAAQTIFGSDAMRTAFALAEGGGKIINDMKTIIGNTDAEQSAATRMDTLSGAWEIFQGVVETLTLGIGDKFLPIARVLVEWLSAVAQQYGPPVIDWFGQLATNIEPVIGWLAEVVKTGTLFNDAFGAMPQPIRDVVTALSDIVIWTTNFVTSTLTIFKPITDAIGQFVSWKDVLIVLGLVIASIAIPAIIGFIVAAAPVVAVFAGIVLAVATLRNAWETDFGGIQEKTKAVFDYIGGVFGPLFDTIKQFGGDALGEIVKWATGQDTEFTATKKIWEAAKESFGEAFGDMGKALKSFGDKAWSEFSDRFPKTAKVLSDAWDKMKEGFVKAQEAVSGAIDYLGKQFSPLGQDIKDFGAGALREIGLWATGNKTDFENTSKIWETAKTTFSTVFTDIGTKLAEWGAIAWDWFKDRFPQAAGALTTAFDSISTNFKELWDAIKPLIDTVVTAFNGLVEDWTTGSSDMGTALQTAQAIIDGVWAIMVSVATLSINTIINVLTLVSQLLTGDWSGAWTTAQQIVNDVTGTLQTIIGTAFDTILKVFGLNKEGIVTWYTDTKTKITEWWNNFSTYIGSRDWSKIGKDILKAFDTLGVTAWYNDTKEKIRLWWEAFKTYLVDKDWFQYGVDIIQGLWNGLTSVWNRFSTWTTGIWNSLVTDFKRVFGISSPSTVFAGFGENIVQGLGDGVSDNMLLALGPFANLVTKVGETVSDLELLANPFGDAGHSIMQGLADGITSAAQIPLSVMGGIYDSITGQVTNMVQGIVSAADQGRAAWEAARIAIINTPAPTYQVPVGVPASQLLGNNAPAAGGILMGGPQTMPGDAVQPPASFGDKKIKDTFDAMNGPGGFGDFMLKVSDFGTTVADAIYAATGTPNDAATQAATSTARYGVEQGDVGSLLAAVQVLIQKLSSVGLGTAFNISAAPNASDRDDIELRDLIAYLNAQYA